MFADRITELFEFAIDGVFAKCRSKGMRIKENIDVFGESLDQIPSLGQAGAALEDDLVAYMPRWTRWDNPFSLSSAL